jgi:hypothetical protein
MKRVILVLVVAACVAGSLFAETRKPSVFVPIINSAIQDTNRWEIWQDNLARFVMPLPGSSPGGFWPKHSGRNYLFGAGIWVGAMDTTDRDTVVVVGYNPNSGATEWGPCLPNGDTSGAMTDSLARVYRSDIPRDTAQWPERDSLGRAVYRSHQDLWAISAAYSPRTPRPLGVYSIRRSLAWNSPGLWGDIVKMEFEVKNVTGRWQGRPRTLRKMIIGLCVDADIGNESGTNGNDQCYAYFTSGSPYPNQAVQYQLVQEFGWSIPPPYFEGMHFVQTPKATDSVRVRDSRYPHTILPGQSLGMTAFKIWDIARDPQGTYLLLAGMFSLSDTNSAYDSDSLGPGDKRFLMCSGPFDLPNDSTVKLVAHIIGANDSLDLRRKAELLGVESPPGPVARNASSVVLYPSFPNPARGSCLIRYALPGPSLVSLKVYDISGRLVRELDRGERPAGVHPVFWDGRNGAGLSVPGGVYLYRLEVGGFNQTRSVVLLR